LVNKKQNNLYPVKFMAMKSEAHLTGAEHPACPACPMKCEAYFIGVAPEDGSGPRPVKLTKSQLERISLGLILSEKNAE
jgi:hypothetical protein